MFVLGTKVDNITRKKAIAKIASFLTERRPHVVITPNPEIVLYAQKHPGYRGILNRANLAIPDGAGLVLASHFLGEKINERVSGADIVPEICRLAKKKGLSIALIGGLNQQTIEQAAAVMKSWGNNVVFANHGVIREHWNNHMIHEKIVVELEKSKAQIIFVAFGHPKQEQWIDSYRSHLPSVRLFIGCGGSLDFIAGTAKRAPAIFRKLWLEWLWRLLTEPKRIKRILNAVIVFPLTVIYESIWKK